MIVVSLPIDDEGAVPEEVRSQYFKAMESFKYLKLKLVRRENLVRNISEAMDESSGLIVPSLLSSCNAVCVGSYFDKYNFLLFKDTESEGEFYVLQHNNGCSGFYLPECSLLVVPRSVAVFFDNKENRDRVERSLDDYVVECRGRSSAVLTGLIDGYSRPYHYFYDRLPSLLFVKKHFPDLTVFSLSNSFFPGEINSGFDEDDINKITRAGGFLFQTFRFPRSSHYDLSFPVVEECKKADDLLYLKPFKKTHFFLWIGLCQEKRRWEGKRQAVVDFIDKARQVLKDPVFIFDGMTCPSLEDVSFFKESYCRKDEELLCSILDEVGDISYIDLIGEKSNKKIVLAEVSDFFFTGALTDSMWPAHLGVTKGIAYSSTISRTQDHYHPLTYILPNEYIKDADDGIENWARKGFEIDLSGLSWLFSNALGFCLDLKDKINKYGIFSEGFSEVSFCASYLGSEKGVFEIGSDEELFVPLYSESLSFDSSQAFSVASRKYSFRVSFWCDREVICKPFVVFYSSLGDEVEVVALDGEGVDDFEVSKGAMYYRLFIRVKGHGKVLYNGFYAQPIRDLNG